MGLLSRLARVVVLASALVACSTAESPDGGETDGETPSDSPTSMEATPDGGTGDGTVDTGGGGDGPANDSRADASADVALDTSQADAAVDSATDVSAMDVAGESPTADAPVVDSPADTIADSLSDTNQSGGDGGGWTVGETQGTLCTPQCGSGQKACGSCVSVDDWYFGCADPTVCGQCQVPNAVPGCDTSGKCAVGTCFLGWGDCDGIVSNGCETDLTAAATCGSCTTPCSGATPVCSNGTCAASCSFPDTNCNGSCANLETSPVHCGTCTTDCYSPFQNLPNLGEAQCSNGVCSEVYVCASGYVGTVVPTGVGYCADPAKDPLVCSGYVAGPGWLVNSSGICGVACLYGFTYCGIENGYNQCVYTGNDVNNCGSCGHQCDANEVCTIGQCQSVESIVIASGLSNPEDIAVDGSDVYFTTLNQRS